jgi:hypothetical protein
MRAAANAAPTQQKARAVKFELRGRNESKTSWPTLSGAGIEFDVAVNVLTGGKLGQTLASA